MYPTRSNIQIIPIKANPSWTGMFRKAKKIAPSLVLAISAVLFLASMIKPAKPYNQALPIINYNVPAEDYVTTETTDPIPIRKEAKSDVPKLSEFSKKHTAAPISAAESIPEESRAYIERYAKLAVSEMSRYGVPASISLAQGLIESRFGTSKLAVANNNHFGIKCFSKHCKKGHCSNFTDDSHKDFFRKFSSAEESWEAHAKLLSSGRYSRLKRHGRNYRAWSYGLKSVGYATDGPYAEKLIGIIEKYELYKYDR